MPPPLLELNGRQRKKNFNVFFLNGRPFTPSLMARPFKKKTFLRLPLVHIDNEQKHLKNIIEYFSSVSKLLLGNTLFIKKKY